KHKEREDHSSCGGRSARIGVLASGFDQRQVSQVCGQTPNTKHQTPKNSQAPGSKPRNSSKNWCLVLGDTLELGLWCCLFSSPRLPIPPLKKIPGPKFQTSSPE